MERVPGGSKFCDDVLDLPPLDTASFPSTGDFDLLLNESLGLSGPHSTTPLDELDLTNHGIASGWSDPLAGNGSFGIPIDDTAHDPNADMLSAHFSAVGSLETPPLSGSFESSVSGCRPEKKKKRQLSPRAVNVLRSWFYTRRDYPYPTEHDKEELQKQTGLSKTQISNWFTNARRRKLFSREPEGETGVGSPLSPLERWKISPPEMEAATTSDIMRALKDTPYHSDQSITHSASRDTGSSNGSSNASSNSFIVGAPSMSSSELNHSAGSEASITHSHLNFERPPTPMPRSTARRRRRRPPHPAKAFNKHKRPPRCSYQCTFCADSFSTKFDWQRHEKTLHLPVEQWTCAPNGGIVEVEGVSVCVFCQAPDAEDDHLEDHHNYLSCRAKAQEHRTFSRKDHLRQHLKLVHYVDHHPLMNQWKDTRTFLLSRCGFCDATLFTWHERADHLANHYKKGADMTQWKGDWGFEPDVQCLVENAMPPYLIGHERRTMDPWRSSDVLRTHEEDEQSPIRSNVPNAFDRYTDLHRELVVYIKTQIIAGVYPSDEMLQEKARQISYGGNDPWDQTYADYDPMWLAAVKHEAGLDTVHQSEISRNMLSHNSSTKTDSRWPSLSALDESLEWLGDIDYPCQSVE